jgi:hypothetical protein
MVPLSTTYDWFVGRLVYALVPVKEDQSNPTTPGVKPLIVLRVMSFTPIILLLFKFRLAHRILKSTGILFETSWQDIWLCVGVDVISVKIPAVPLELLVVNNW